MSEEKLLIERVDRFEKIKIPERATSGSSGYDLYANDIKRLYSHAGGNGERKLSGDELSKRISGSELSLSYLERALIGTGIKATVGPGYEIQIRPRSGTALKQGLTVINTPGTIDEDYRDEIGIIVVNLSRATQIIRRGDRIAQMVICPIITPEIEIMEKLPDPKESKRAGGFGSTGVN